jgi:hypothetical protein
VKTLIFLGITVGSIIGSIIGSKLDGGNMLGVWSIMLGGVGSIAGLWAGYKLGRDYFEL